MANQSPNNPQQNQDIDHSDIKDSNVNQNQVNVTVHTGSSKKTEPRLTKLEYRNRRAILDKVKKSWVESILENSLCSQARIELGLELRFDLLNLDYATPQEPRQPLPKGTKISEKFFDQLGMGRSLLLLGDPGSGKTTTLLELARDLIEQAAQDVNLPIPIVFNLSSWKDPKQKLANWLVQEMIAKYQVDKSISQAWIQEQQLMLLLDGLDEVSQEHRAACVSAINDFSQTNGQTDIAICCRIKDYESLSRRLNIQGAIFIQPLTSDQINNYLTQAGEELVGVRVAIKTDVVLQELARTPLMLSIMALAYRGVSIDTLPQSDLEESRRFLFQTYIDQMLQRRGQNKHYSREQTLKWLSWLARKMYEESQTVFLIERLQPEWLSTQQQRYFYTFGFGIALSLGVTLLLGSMIEWLSRLIGAHAPLGYLLVAGISAGILWGIAFLHWQERISEPSNRVRLGVIGSLVWGSYVFLWGNLMPAYLGSGLIYGLLLGFLSGLITDRVNPVEKLKWSWSSAKTKFTNGLVVGLLVGIITGAVFGFIYTIGAVSSMLAASCSGIIFGLIFGLVFELIGGLIGAIFGGFSGSEIEIRTVPNQGIYQSAKNAVAISIAVGFTLEILFRLLGLPIFSGAGLGILLGVFVGGSVCIKHGFLRLLLYLDDKIPWNYAHFLDYCASCIILQRVGGNYVFIHRLLLEHLAIEPES
jgi:DNA polymerase III delta prime subunit